MLLSFLLAVIALGCFIAVLHLCTTEPHLPYPFVAPDPNVANCCDIERVSRLGRWRS